MQSLKCNMSYSQDPFQLSPFINFIVFIVTVVLSISLQFQALLFPQISFNKYSKLWMQLALKFERFSWKINKKEEPILSF